MAINSFIDDANVNNDKNNKNNNKNNNNNSIYFDNSASFNVPIMPSNKEEELLNADELGLINYNKKYKDATPIQFRDNVIKQTLETLISKNKPNALLVGPAGIGKTKVVEEIARLLANNDPLIPKTLKDFTIYELPLVELTADTGIVGVLERKVINILDFIKNPENKAILFIDEIHQIMTNTTYKQVAQYLKPPLARGEIHFIGATTDSESKVFMQDPAFSRRMSNIIMQELNKEQTFHILQYVKEGLIKHYDDILCLDDEDLKCIVRQSSKFKMPGMHQPDSAITLMDRVMAKTLIEYNEKLTKAKKQDKKIYEGLKNTSSIKVTEKMIINTARQIMSGNAKIENINFDSLSEQLHKIKGQDEIIKSLIKEVKRSQLGIFETNTPNSYLFTGPSGVGKTELSKLLAKAITDEPPIILHMSEYKTEAELNRIIGSPPGYVGSDSNAELVLSKLETNPYKVVLLDEFEKCHTSVKNFFITALKEGYIKTNKGNEIDLSKATIIATTNVRDEVKKEIGFGQVTNKANKQNYTSEFLNGFNKVYNFNVITKEIFKDILHAEYKETLEHIREENPLLTLRDIDEDYINTLVDTYYESQLGAKPIKNIIRSEIENQLI